MIDLLSTVLIWGLIVVVALLVVGSVVFFAYDTVATFLESRNKQKDKR